MKTTQQINSVKTLKRLIAETVFAHKKAKEDFGRTESYLFERQRLFVMYTLYYMIRHEIEDVDSYIKSVYDDLKYETRQTYLSWGYPTWIMKKEPTDRRKCDDGRTDKWTILKDAVLKMKECLDNIVSKESSNGDGAQG
jgi:hypothetical protein